MTHSINKIINQTIDLEDEKTKELFKLSDTIKKQGFLRKDEIIKILKWKSPRPLRFYNENNEEDVIRITKLAFEQIDDRLKIQKLTSLKGVNYPTASAILMFYDKINYPVLDIRVWKQLYKNNMVDENPGGQSFSLDQWIKYLEIIRGLAKKHQLSSRQIEKRLFDYDKENQVGNLYR